MRFGLGGFLELVGGTEDETGDEESAPGGGKEKDPSGKAAGKAAVGGGGPIAERTEEGAWVDPSPAGVRPSSLQGAVDG